MTHNTPPILGRRSTHPGEILREDVLPAVPGMTPNRLAIHLKLPRRKMSRILAEKTPISPPIARRLGKIFGNTSEFWMGLQTGFDRGSLPPL